MTGSKARNKTDFVRARQTAWDYTSSHRLALDALTAAYKVGRDVKARCAEQRLGYYTRVYGQSAEIVEVVCQGQTSDAPVFAADFIVRDGKEFRSVESMLSDRSIIEDMINTVALAESWTNATSLIPLFGEIESANQCLGIDTLTLHALRRLYEGKNALERATIAGWKPLPSNSSVDTAINCVGAIPLAGKLGKVASWAKKGADALRATMIANAAKYGEMFRVFDAPTAPGQFATSIENVRTLFPGNADLAAFAKAVYNSMQLDFDLAQTASGSNDLYNRASRNLSLPK